MGYLRVSLLSLIAFLLLFWFSGPAGIVLLPLLIALLIYVLGQDFIGGRPPIAPKPRPKSKKKTRKAAPARPATQMRFASTLLWLGALVGFLGSVIAVVALSPEHFVSYVQRMPQIANQDIIPGIYGRQLQTLVLSNQASSLGGPAFIILTTALTAGFSFSLGFVARRYRQYASWALVAVTCLVFVTAVFQATGEFRQVIAEEPGDYQYAFDGVVYLKTFYVMKDRGFYPALVEANAKDSRANANVSEGKLHGLIYSPFWFRTPVIFYFWRVLTFGNGVGVLYLGMLAASGVMVLSYLAGKSLVGESGAFLSVAVMPYLVMGTMWYNLFYPDWWAALALTAGILLWIREQYWPAAAAFLFAGASREVVFVFLPVFLALALLQKKAARLPFAAATGLFLLVYPFHFFHAKQFIGAPEEAVGSITGHLAAVHFVPASSYQMFPYGYFLWPAYVLMIVAVVVWAWKKRFDLLALSVLAFPYFAYTSSTYWGQHLLPFVIFSAFTVFLLKTKEIGLADLGGRKGQT